MSKAYATMLDEVLALRSQVARLREENERLTKKLRAENERAFRAEHRELVSAACWHRAALEAKNGNWSNLTLRLREMTAEERHAAVVLSMDAQRAKRSSIASERRYSGV